MTFSVRTGWTLLLTTMLVAGCLPPASGSLPGPTALPPTSTPDPLATPLPVRKMYNPGELVDYTAQSGDTLPALAARFNTTEAEIRAANPILPERVTTLPAGLPMKIPIYYLPLWGTTFKAFPDSAFVYGPGTIGFDTAEFLSNQPGWFKDYREYAGGSNRSAAGLVDYVAVNFSVDPRLLLALLEYQSGALTNPQRPADTTYLLERIDRDHRGVYLQLVWAANTLNNGYYGWRTGRLTQFEHPDGRLERPDPWQNAGTVGVQYYFAQLYSMAKYDRAVGPDGLLRTYRELFGDPWQRDQPLIPGSLEQPEMRLPFARGQSWTYTGGPHTGWGTGDPFAAIDFAPPASIGGCSVADQPSLAVADGTVVRTDTGVVVLDLDGDGDERTGWVVFYLHVAAARRVQVGMQLKAGDPVGYPSCEGGRTTGTHIHIARKYNGEWIVADGPLAFTLEGWVAHNGPQPYLGTLTRDGRTITACECSDIRSTITAGR